MRIVHNEVALVEQPTVLVGEMASAQHRLVPVRPEDGGFYPEHLSLALEATQLGYWQLDLRSGELSSSPQCKAKYGRDPGEEFTLEMFFESVHPEDRQRVKEAFQLAGPRALEGDPNLAVEYRAHLADGQVRWHLSQGIVLLGPEGDPSHVVGVTLDITKRKQAELKLQQQVQREKLFNRLIQAISTSLDLPALFEVAVQEVGQVLQAARVTLYQYLPTEKVWVGIAGYVRSPDVPSTLQMRIPDDPQIPTIQQLQQLQVFHVADPQQVSDPFALQERQDHQLGPWLTIPVACQGKLWGALALRRLISEPDWQEEEIELARAIGNHLAVAIRQAELYQKLQQANAELDYQVRVRNGQLQQAYEDEALLQLITEEIRSSLDEHKILETVAQELALRLGLSGCMIALHDPERQVSVLALDYRPGEGIRRFPLEIPFADFAEVLQQLQGGQFCYFSNLGHPCWPSYDRHTLLVLPICDAQEGESLLLGNICGSRPPGQVFGEREQRLMRRVASQCAIAIRQARLFQTVQQQVQQLQELNHLKDEFLHMVSHEMRTPLTNMKLAIAFLSKANLTEREQRYLQILEMETNRELDLINELLELQAIEAGNRDLNLTWLSPQEWIPNLSEPFRLRAAQQNQQFQLEWDPDLLPLCTDESLLSRVVGELLNNACKYTPAGESICLRFSQTHQQNRPGWLIEVRNTGVEIPPEALPHVFEKFYRIPQLDRRKAGGTGLGLPLAKKAMEMLKGSLTVESRSRQVIFQVWCPHQGSLSATQNRA
ncbi:GAF domain-containing protein [Synechococcus sp. H55.8]|uniref:GAF domain-containing protein n=1 Tax=Synechococcus sp. H55.8 TaxID=2964510 RepID=UPI0039C002E2